MNDPNLNLVAYCGLYCGLCAHCNRIPHCARNLRDTMTSEGYDDWGGAIPGFEPFWKFLCFLGESEARCSCRNAECGPPFCPIRPCARAKGVEICVFCAEYPCRHIQELAQRYPTLIADGERLKRHGLAAWIGEQEERRRSGFAYADIRCLTHEDPDG